MIIDIIVQMKTCLLLLTLILIHVSHQIDEVESSEIDFQLLKLNKSLQDNLEAYNLAYKRKNSVANADKYTRLLAGVTILIESKNFTLSRKCFDLARHIITTRQSLTKSNDAVGASGADILISELMTRCQICSERMSSRERRFFWFVVEYVLNGPGPSKDFLLFAEKYKYVANERLKLFKSTIGERQRKFAKDPLILEWADDRIAEYLAEPQQLECDKHTNITYDDLMNEFVRGHWSSDDGFVPESVFYTQLLFDNNSTLIEISGNETLSVDQSDTYDSLSNKVNKILMLADYLNEQDIDKLGEKIKRLFYST